MVLVGAVLAIVKAMGAAAAATLIEFVVGVLVTASVLAVLQSEYTIIGSATAMISTPTMVEQTPLLIK